MATSNLLGGMGAPFSLFCCSSHFLLPGTGLPHCCSAFVAAERSPVLGAEESGHQQLPLRSHSLACRVPSPQAQRLQGLWPRQTIARVLREGPGS